MFKKNKCLQNQEMLDKLNLIEQKVGCRTEIVVVVSVFYLYLLKVPNSYTALKL